MPTTRTCPQCQQPLTADAPDGLCPQCLLQAAASPPPNVSGDGLLGEIIDIADPVEVAKKLPQFEILELLGRGGMGVVYRARQPQLDRLVALKILPPVDALSADFVARFTREARALAKLNHPNIVNVHDFGETGGLYYIVMEYVDGANLRQLLEARKLTSVEALAIVPKICDALQYAHEEGLVHRDIKPENLLIDKKGRVKIADFGLAKLLRREALDMTLTLSGTALGTLRYMAPEQMDKPETVDHRADLYSLGVVIYEMLTGETPVGRFDLPSQRAPVDVRLDQIVLHALEREPARRYQHASEVRDDVEKLTSKPAVAPAPLLKGQEKRILLHIPAGLVFSVLVLAVVAASWIELSREDLSSSGIQVVLMLICLVVVGTIILIKRDWENRRLPLARKIILTMLRLICSFCFILFVNGRVTVSSPGNYLAFAIGAPFPWFIFERAKGFTVTHYNLWSWSWVIVAAGCFGHYGLGKLKNAWVGKNAAGADGDDSHTRRYHWFIPIFKFTVAPSSDQAPAAATQRTGFPAPESKPGASAGTILPGQTLAGNGSRASCIPAWLIAACVLGLAGCLWPYSIAYHSFLGQTETREILTEPGITILGNVGLPEYLPATKAGIILGDTLLTIGGRTVHVMGLDNPEHIWKETPVGADVEITLQRNHQTMTLHAIRSPDPVAVIFYAVWQFFAGFFFFLFAVFVLLTQPYQRAARWRGAAGAILGLFMTLSLFLDPGSVLDQPAKELSNVLENGHNYAPSTFEQKAAACAASLALLLLGVMEIRRGPKERQLASPPPRSRKT